jgi:hypothetical protein
MRTYIGRFIAFLIIVVFIQCSWLLPKIYLQIGKYHTKNFFMGENPLDLSFVWSC